MVELPQQELVQWKEGLQREILDLEAKVRPLMEKLADLREKQSAIERLLGSDHLHGAGTRRGGGLGAHAKTAEFAGSGSFAPTHAYWVPILQSLVELGGRRETDTVLNLVEQKMKGVLRRADFEVLPSGISVRWKNRAQWQRKNMVDQGLLRRDSPRGIWEITEDGRKWLENNGRRRDG